MQFGKIRGFGGGGNIRLNGFLKNPLYLGHKMPHKLEVDSYDDKMTYLIDYVSDVLTEFVRSFKTHIPGVGNLLKFIYSGRKDGLHRQGKAHDEYGSF